MSNRNTILNELVGLESSLAQLKPWSTYTVPAGYFDGLADQVLNRIKAMEAANAKDELKILSTMLDGVSRKIPLSVPGGYFDSLTENLLQAVREHADYQTSNEEIESLSPVLSSIRHKNPYAAPAGYFENLQPGIPATETKIISITRRRWYRIAAAAVIVGIVAIGGLMFINQNKIDPNKNPQAWIEKNVKKKVSGEKIDAFVTLATEDELNTSDPNDAVKPGEIKELMKDVSEKEIQDFLNDAVALGSNDDAGTLMN